MTEQERINQLVDMLDEFAKQGGGHMNITVEDSMFASGDREIRNALSADCQGNSACAVPTLHQGIDET